MTAEPSLVDRSDPAHAGQAIYTTRTLRAYDAVVVKLSNSFVWHCPARRIRAHYEHHLSTSHLDVGPGTGYYLDRSRFHDRNPHITLLDPNAEVLQFAGRRLRRYRPDLVAANALEPIALEPRSFDSVGLGFVLHCLPGDLAAKAMVFDHIEPLVARGGVIFGTTILSDGVHHTRLGRRLMGIYNKKGIFSNVDDDLDGLHRELAARFRRHELDVVGAVALFAGWVS